MRLCRDAGFRKVRLQGDTDFSQTTHLDRWNDDGVEFVFGMDAMANLVKIAKNLPYSVWKELKRKSKTVNKTKQTRAKRPKFKEQFVVEKKYQNKILEQEFVAEFDYRPAACRNSYRMVVLRKQVTVMKGPKKLFDESPYFFYITNLPKTVPPTKIVAEANSRCDQENIIAQGKAMGALSAPLNDLVSNWAYMVMAILAWNLKCWLSLSLKEAGNAKAGSHGLQYVPAADDADSGPDADERSASGLSVADVDAVGGDSFLSSRQREASSADLTCSLMKPKSGRFGIAAIFQQQRHDQCSIP